MAASMILTAHEKDLGGGFKVRRLLPSATKQAVGPFLLFDHFGPIEAEARADQDIRPHPHIGLATVTYLFEGAIDHRDSLGSVQRIEPGAINWMTAGSGIVHSERTPQHLIGKVRRSHGLQLWAGLPKEHEETAPCFSHTPAAAIPVITVGGADIRVLIGKAFGLSSPVATFSETLYLDVTLRAEQEIVFDMLPPEAAIYPIEGRIEFDSAEPAMHTMTVLDTENAVRVSAKTHARFVLIGGAPLDGHRFMWWNFVSSSKERIVQAADDWSAQRFQKVPGETEWTPLPKSRF